MSTRIAVKTQQPPNDKNDERQVVDVSQIATLNPPSLPLSYGYEALGLIVVHWRMQRGLSAEELASDAGISIEVVRELESGRGPISARHLLTLSELLEISFEKVLRLVGLIQVEHDDLLHAALQLLAITASYPPDGPEASKEVLRFRVRLGGADSPIE